MSRSRSEVFVWILTLPALLVLVLGGIFVLSARSAFSAPVSLNVPAEKPDGKDVFLKYTCNTCHSVSTAGIERKVPNSTAPDLVDVTVRHEKPWIRKFIRQNEVHVSCPVVDKARDGKKHLILFTGTQEEEDALIDWLDQQRSKK